MKIVEMNIEDIIPYENNPRYNDDAVYYVKNSIKEFGFQQPIVLDKNNVIVVGHTRYMASKELGLKKVPCTIASNLTDEQIKAYRIADNKTAEFASWNFELLDAELEDIEIDMSEFGIDIDSFEYDADVGGVDDKYTKKTEIPHYDITGDEPDISELIDTEKADTLIEEINKADLPDDIRKFLTVSAYRHIVFNYSKIAEWYANQNEQIQNLAEDSALVLIDYDNAIRNGYVELTARLEGMMGE